MNAVVSPASVGSIAPPPPPSDQIENAVAPPPEAGNDLDALLDETIARDASDLHLVAGEPPVFRVRGALVRADGASWGLARLEAAILAALPPPLRFAVAEGTRSSASALIERGDFAFILYAFRENGGRLAATVRVMPPTIPTLEQIGGTMTDRLKAIAELPRGLVLFTGPTGSGKATTVCAVLEEINRTRPDRIFLLEGTPGYRFTSKTGVVSALYIGQDAPTYAHAAQSVWEGADPDVVYFADLASEADLNAALTLAETGHLVFAQLTARSATDALSHLAVLGRSGDHARRTLAQNLVAVFNQRLLPRADRPGRVCAYEYLPANNAVRDALQNDANEAALWEAARENNNPGGAQTHDEALAALLASGEVSAEVAATYRNNR